MPIYAYRCAECGHTKDVLQKLSDPVLSDCPSCGKPAFSKQLTAAGFQLKGSGWYVTDFRGGSSSGAAASAKPDGEAAKSESSPSDAASSSSTTASASSDSGGSAGGCGTSCACH